MKKKLLALMMGSALVLGACGGGGDTTEEPAGYGDTEEAAGGTETTAAEGLYKQSCASCHGQNLGGGVGPALTAVGAKLSQDDIKSIIENGQGSMPAGLLQGDDASVVAEWLATKK